MTWHRDLSACEVQCGFLHVHAFSLYRFTCIAQRWTLGFKRTIVVEYHGIVNKHSFNNYNTALPKPLVCNRTVQDLHYRRLAWIASTVSRRSAEFVSMWIADRHLATLWVYKIIALWFETCRIIQQAKKLLSVLQSTHSTRTEQAFASSDTREDTKDIDSWRVKRAVPTSFWQALGPFGGLNVVVWTSDELVGPWMMIWFVIICQGEQQVGSETEWDIIMS